MSVRHKAHLPNYAVFDEKRLFTQGKMPQPWLRNLRVGLPICEDIWFDDALIEISRCRILVYPMVRLLSAASMKSVWRARARAMETGLPLVYVNQFGQDELVFDGGSFIMQGDGTPGAQLPVWQEALEPVVLTDKDGRLACDKAMMADMPSDDKYTPQVHGLRDYGEKPFPRRAARPVGGIDSAVCAAMAVDALGAKRVHCVMLPSQYTSTESLEDAAACAAALGVKLDTVPIAPPVDAVEQVLAPVFKGHNADITEENIQSRLRGTLLMAMSNKFGNMVVTTGNKSEVSVGYATSMAI